MNEQSSYQSLTHKEMQELLPDYIFGRISIEDKAAFEHSLSNYQDIMQEVKEGKAVFQRLERMDFDRFLAQKTRNLSVKVNERLRRKNNQFEKFSWSLRYAVPSFGLIVIIMILIWGNDLFLTNKNIPANQTAKDTISEVIENEGYQILNINEVAALMNNYTSTKELNILTESIINPAFHVSIDEGSKVDQNIDNIVNNYIGNNIKLVKCAKSYSKIYSQFTAPDLIEQLSQLDEDEFQEILKELENADINS
jgi:hypothetical protein